jgi:hypothetical protein
VKVIHTQKKPYLSGRKNSQLLSRMEGSRTCEWKLYRGGEKKKCAERS